MKVALRFAIQTVTLGVEDPQHADGEMKIRVVRVFNQWPRRRLTITEREDGELTLTASSENLLEQTLSCMLADGSESTSQVFLRPRQAEDRRVQKVCSGPAGYLHALLQRIVDGSDAQP